MPFLNLTEILQAEEAALEKEEKEEVYASSSLKPIYPRKKENQMKLGVDSENGK
jgi:hypothetical protein